MRDPSQQFDYDPSEGISAAELATSMRRCTGQMSALIVEQAQLMAALAKRGDDPADIARILLDEHDEGLRFHVARLLRP